MRPEYDLRGGVRGKYYERYKQGTKEGGVLAGFERSHRKDAATSFLKPSRVKLEGLKISFTAFKTQNALAIAAHIQSIPRLQFQISWVFFQ